MFWDCCCCCGFWLAGKLAGLFGYCWGTSCCLFTFTGEGQKFCDCWLGLITGICCCMLWPSGWICCCCGIGGHCCWVGCWLKFWFACGWFCCCVFGGHMLWFGLFWKPEVGVGHCCMFWSTGCICCCWGCKGWHWGWFGWFCTCWACELAAGLCKLNTLEMHKWKSCDNSRFFLVFSAKLYEWLRVLKMICNCQSYRTGTIFQIGCTSCYLHWQ